MQELRKRVEPRRRAGPRALGRRALLVVLAGALAGCATWRRAARYEGWTLYEVPGDGVAVAEYAAAFDPAFEAVERCFGPFQSRVNVHAWHGSVRVDDAGRTRVRSAEATGVHDVPGIGPARIQAYHARGGRGPFARTGVFIGVPDAGTAVHELVHARLAELDRELPLWFEEGIATLMGDGLLCDGRWVVDGLACWPLRELREERLADGDLARLLSVTASDETSVRDNVLVHFIGWAVVFDLYRETGAIDWRRWLARIDVDDPLPDVRRRLDRTLADATERAWLLRLRDGDPAVRLATAKGVWKLRSLEVLDALLVALADEPHPEVRVGLAVNALAAAGEVPLSWRRWRRVEQAVRAGLRDAALADAAERRAAEELASTYRSGSDRERAHAALRELARFWEE